VCGFDPSAKHGGGFVITRRSWVALAATLTTLVVVPQAGAATLSVDDDGSDCPAAPYSSVQDAINAANPGDTVAVCPGSYVEGSGAPGTNTLTITKDLTLKGAGADDVSIKTKRSTPSGGQIATGSPALRDNVGNIATIQGGTSTPITVNISGITFSGNGVYVEGGVLFLDAKGSFNRSRITNVVTSEFMNADTIPGGYRSSNFGFGLAMATQALTPPLNPTRPLTVDSSRIEQYNKVGVWIDSATADSGTLVPTGVVNQLTMKRSSIAGRNDCPNYVPSDPAAGNCSTAPATTGPNSVTQGATFGQDGLRVTAGSTANVTDSIISSNHVNGTGRPTPNSATNNANLPLGSGVRLIGAGTSIFNRNNLTDNAYGVYNVQLDGVTAAATQLNAENNWWGLRYTSNPTNAGPAVSPVTNPAIPENPVNGTATVVDPQCVNSASVAVPNSSAVDFCPFRNLTQSDPNNGEYPIADNPLPVNDAPPTINLNSDQAEYDRGDTVHLTADAADDFGVKNVTFFNGFQQLGVDSQPPYTQDFEIPSNAPCAEKTFTAVARDSADQTASDDVTIDITGPNDCIDEPPPPDEPTIEFDNPPTHIPQAGVVVTADPTVDDSLTVDEVQFFLGDRLVCTDDTGPSYTCNVLANGDEVGSQTLRAVVADSAAQTAEDSTPVIVDKFAPTSLSINHSSSILPKHKQAKKKKKVKVSHVISGELGLPSRVDPEDGCSSGHVTLNILKNGHTLYPSTQVDLQPDCTYELAFITKKRKRAVEHLDVTATFPGNSVLTSISNQEAFSS
jgi:hypothetical protein